MSSVKIQALNIYPVKSLGGMSVEQAVVTSRGLAGDREWMLVDAQGLGVTQRTHPKMALVQAQWQGDVLRLSAAGHAPLSVAVPLANSPLHNVSLWKDACQAQEAPREVNAWLTHACQSTKPLRLMYFHKPKPRAQDTKRFGQHSTFFADAAPYLIANQASVEALNQTLRKNREMPVTMARFRANIVVSGLPAFAEHNISTLQNNRLNFAIIDHCQRCSIITLDPTSGTLHPKQSPLKSLAKTNAMPNKPKAPAFGVNSVLQKGEGATLCLGDTLQAPQLTT